RSAAIVFLQPLLVLALEFLFKDNAMDISALFSEAFLLAQIGAIKLRVMRQLSRPAHALVERLLTHIVAIATMAFEKMMAALRQGYGALAAIERHEPRQAFVAQMTQVRLSPLPRLLP